MVELMTVNSAKEVGLIPESFFSYIPDTCPCCGQPMYISQSRTVLKCKNASCVRKVAFQADALLKDLGIKGYGPVSLENYCNTFHINSILDFIQKPPPPFNLIELMQEKNPTFTQLVEMLHIPNFGTKAFKLFDGFNSYMEFIDALAASEDSMQFLRARVSGEETLAVVIDIMHDYTDSLKNITSLVTVRNKSDNIILIQITGHVLNVRAEDGSSLTKDEYITVLNNIGIKGGYEFRMSSALQSVKFIVADTPSNTRKYRIGQERGVLVTSDKLLASISLLVEGSC